MSTPELVEEPLEHPDTEVHTTFSDVFSQALRGHPTSVRGIPSGEQQLPVHDWLQDASHSDRTLLSHCRGTTLDVGCGPGRMSARLAQDGHTVLAVDIVHEAVAQARERGVPALRRNIFEAMPGEGQWDTVLLADGNIGIGGDPVALLVRSRGLLAPGGRVVVDLAPEGTGLQLHEARLVSRGRRSSVFPWAEVGADAIETTARAAGLRPERVEEHHGRWFAVLVR